jgi:hypothetical protein
MIMTQAAPKSLFDQQLEKMQKAQMGRGGKDWIEGPGLFEIEVLTTKKMWGWNKSFTVRDKELFIVQFRLLHSTNPNHAEQSTASWTCKDPSDGGAGDVKAFCIACVGIDPRLVKETDEGAQLQASLLALAAQGEAEAFARLGLPEDFFIGRRVKLETKMVKTKALNDFTKHIWSPAVQPEQ